MLKNRAIRDLLYKGFFNKLIVKDNVSIEQINNSADALKVVFRHNQIKSNAGNKGKKAVAIFNSLDTYQGCYFIK